MRSMRRAAWCVPLLVAAGCSEVTAPDPGAAAFQRVPLDAALVQGYTGFGFTLFERLAAAAPGENLFVSPTSAAFALAMTYNGAAGETHEAMARTLGMGDLPMERVNAGNRAWLDALRDTQDPRVELSLANSIWARQGFPFRAEFYDRNRGFYDAEVRELPFDDAAVGIINGWVRQHTRGRIDRILDRIPGNAVMYLINALHFKGEWTYRFDPKQTRREGFTRADGSRVEVEMMRQQAKVGFLRDDGFQMVELPYGNGRFSMVLALPDHGHTLDGFRATLTPERWDAWMGAIRTQEVAVILPRFRMEWERSLVETLTGMGMGIAFEGGRADFSGMTSGRGLYISEVKQKSWLNVDEKGTEAAAVTVVEMSRVCTGCGPDHPIVRFDRPFFLAIRDNATGTLLFLGQVADPTAD
jgi:serine protease inhibitor